MFKKNIFAASVLFVLVFSAMTAVCFADTPAQLKSQARNLMKARNYEQAEAIYKDIVRDYPGTEYDFLARKNLVLIYIIKERYDQAQEVLDKLIGDFSNNMELPEALYDIAKRYERSGKYEKAKSIFERIIRQCPDSSKVKGAHDHIRKIDVLSLIRSRDYTAAQQAVDKLTIDYSGNRSLPGILYDIANGYRASGRYEEAKGIYGDIVTKYPDTEEASGAEEMLVSIYVSLEGDGGVPRALEGLSRDYSGSSSFPAMLYIIAGRSGSEAAKNIYRTIARDYPGTEPAFKAQSALALRCIASGEYAEADSILDRLLKDYPGHSGLQEAVTRIAEQYYIEAFRMEGEGLAGQAKDNFQKAAGLWQMAIDKLPTDPYTMPNTCSWAGDCYNRLG